MNPKSLIFPLIAAFSTLFSSGQETWDSYHSTQESHALLDQWSKAYPDLTKVYSIGETLKGTKLMLPEISNKKTGDAETKPAYYLSAEIQNVGYLPTNITERAIEPALFIRKSITSINHFKTDT